jgi:hypothetical protein
MELKHKFSGGAADREGKLMVDRESVVAYGSETWCVTLREKNRPRVCENKMLRKVSGPKNNEVTGEWR